MQISIFLVLALGSMVALSARVRECKQASDCGPNECCRIGMQRYSVPFCQPLGQIGDTCLMYNNEPRNLSLSYPNGQIDVYNVYTLFCPCESSLHCARAHCTE